MSPEYLFDWKERKPKSEEEKLLLKLIKDTGIPKTYRNMFKAYLKWKRKCEHD